MVTSHHFQEMVGCTACRPPVCLAGPTGLGVPPQLPHVSQTPCCGFVFVCYAKQSDSDEPTSEAPVAAKFLSPIASPLAGKKLHSKLYKAVKKGEAARVCVFFANPAPRNSTSVLRGHTWACVTVDVAAVVVSTARAACGFVLWRRIDFPPGLSWVSGMTAWQRSVAPCP